MKLFFAKIIKQKTIVPQSNLNMWCAHLSLGLCFVMVFASYVAKTHAKTSELHYGFPGFAPGVINMLPFQGVFLQMRRLWIESLD